MCIDPVTDLVAPKNLIFKVPPLISTGCWIPYVMKSSLEHKFISNFCQVTKDKVGVQTLSCANSIFFNEEGAKSSDSKIIFLLALISK